MTDTLEIIRRHHEQIVAEERPRRRSESELRRLLPVLRVQAEQWRQAGGREADCPLVPLIEGFERTLRGGVAEGPSPSKAMTAADSIATANGEATPEPVASAPALEAHEHAGADLEQGSGRGRGRRKSGE